MDDHLVELEGLFRAEEESMTAFGSECEKLRNEMPRRDKSVFTFSL